MFQENRIETCILSRVKQITSPGWMHETSAQTWCTGKTQRDRVEREGGEGIRMGNTCKPMLFKMHTHAHVIESFVSVWYTFLLWTRFFQKLFPFGFVLSFGALIYFPFHYSFSSYLWISLYLLSIESCSFLLLYYNLTILIPVSFFVCVCLVENEGYKMRWGDSVSSRGFWARTTFSQFLYLQGTICCML